METNKYCKALFAATSSVLLVITALTITPIRADAQVFDKPVVYGVDDIITDDEYPAAVHNFMFKYHNAIISSKYKPKRLSRITESYAEACTREPSWKLYCSAYYGRCLMAGYNPDHLKARGAKILEDALSDPSESQLTVPDRLTFIIDLANAYLYGDGVENNDAKAFDLYRQAQNISPIFNGIIATCYLVGIGTPVDVDKACYYYALNYDDPELNIIRCKERNYERIYAVSYNRINDVSADIQTGYYEALRSIFKHDYDKAKELLDKNCTLGHTPSMYALAGVYEETGDDKSATELYRQAMSAGYLPGEFVYDMKQMYQGVNNLSIFESRGESKAFPAFEELADKGYLPAAEMCSLYDSGTFSKKSNVGAAIVNGLAKGIAATMIAANEIMDSGLLDTGSGIQNEQCVAAIGGSGQNNHPNYSTPGNSTQKNGMTREYEYVKTVSGIYEPEQTAAKLHIYRSRDNGDFRASTVYNTKGLDRAATYRINSGWKVFYEERYSNYISYYGLCTYFNY